MKAICDRTQVVSLPGGTTIHYGLKVFQSEAAGQAAVFLTELNDNPGASVRSAIEQLANQIVTEFRFHAGRVTWIQHAPTGAAIGDTFELVTFTSRASADTSGEAVLCDPIWTPCTLEEAERIVGRKLQ